MLENEIELRAVFTAKELLLRWPGISEDILASMVKDTKLWAFLQMRKVRSPDGGTVYYCRPGATPWGEDDCLTGEYYWEGVLFRVEDVEELEGKHPEFKWPLIDEAGPETPSASELAKILGHLREENMALSGKVAFLEAKNAELRSKIGHFESPPAGAPIHLEVGKDRKTAERWKGHLQTCIPLALHVKAEGRAFTTEELRKACGVLKLPALGEEALEIFRKAMPSDCINTGGRPSKK